MRDIRSPLQILHHSGAGTALALLSLWIVVGTVGFALLEHFSFVDALYLSVLTLTTVGYGDIVPATAAGRLFAGFLVLGGLGTVLYALTRLGQSVIEGELRDFLGMRRNMNQIDRLKDHYIIAGYGRTARPVVEGLLAENVALVVVERDAAIAKELHDAGLLHIQGDATDEEVLAQAGIERAKGLLALLPSDPENLYLTISAASLNPQARIVARGSDDKAVAKLRRAGASEVVSPYQMAGQRVMHAILRPNVLEFMELAHDRSFLNLSLEEVPIEAASALAGQTIAGAQIRRKAGAIIVAIRHEGRPDMTFNPGPDEVLRAGDILVALGRPEDLRSLTGLCH